MQTLLQDIRYALRQLRHAPTFTLTALLTLALGIGATTAIFTLTQAIMLKSLPVADPAQLYRIGDTEECCVEGWEDDDWSLFSYPLYQRLAAAAPEFEETTAFQAAPGIYSIRQEAKDREARPLRAEYVSGNYFHVFGLGAFAGRVINNSDDQQSASPVAMISYRTWQQAYGSDPGIVGSTFFVQGQRHVDWHYASGIFWRDAAERSAGLLAAPATGDFVRRPECAHENESSPVAVCHWQVEAGCERASTSRPANAGAPTVAP